MRNAFSQLKITKMKKPQFNLFLNLKSGFCCAPVKSELKECIPISTGTFKECKRQADVMNKQYEKIW